MIDVVVDCPSSVRHNVLLGLIEITVVGEAHSVRSIPVMRDYDDPSAAADTGSCTLNGLNIPSNTHNGSWKRDDFERGVNLCGISCLSNELEVLVNRSPGTSNR